MCIIRITASASIGTLTPTNRESAVLTRETETETERWRETAGELEELIKNWRVC